MVLLNILNLLDEYEDELNKYHNPPEWWKIHPIKHPCHYVWGDDSFPKDKIMYEGKTKIQLDLEALKAANCIHYKNLLIREWKQMHPIRRCRKIAHFFGFHFYVPSFSGDGKQCRLCGLSNFGQ